MADLSAQPIEIPLLLKHRAAPTHSGIGVARYYGMHARGAIFPVSAGLLLLGWRAAGMMLVILVSVTLATEIWRRIGMRGPQLRLSHTLWLGFLLAMTLPAELFRASPGSWLILPAASVAMVVFTWLLGGLGSSRVHPVLLTYLLLVVLFGDQIEPAGVLQRDRLFTGDVTRAAHLIAMPNAPWIRTEQLSDVDAISRERAVKRLAFYTRGAQQPDRAGISLTALLRNGLPPLEDLIIGGEPAPIACVSAIATIVGGLFLLYHGLIDYRIPILMIFCAYAALLVLPIPTVITDTSVQWRWLAFRDPAVGWPEAITFVNYEVIASPLIFTAFFLATAPALRPMVGRARVLYAIVAGALTAIFQLYTSVAFGPYLGLLFASLLTPTLDKRFGPRPLI